MYIIKIIQTKNRGYFGRSSKVRILPYPPESLWQSLEEWSCNTGST